MVSLSDTRQIPIARQMGIDNALSPRMSCENRVLSILSSEKVSSAVSFYDDTAEILEIKVSKECTIAAVPFAQLSPYLPRRFLFGVIQSQGQITIPTGKSVIAPGDTVIAITHPEHLPELNQLF
jgi:trk system potassium uptake protein TrkA